MKKLFVCLMLIVVAFAGCAGDNSQNSKMSSGEVASFEGNATIEETINNLIKGSFDIRCLYFVSADEMYDWNDTKNTKEVNGITYYLVTSDRFKSYKDFEDYIKSIFTEKIADIYLKKENYINCDGKLYTMGGAAGSLYDYDKYTYKILNQTENEIEIELSIPADETTGTDVSKMKFAKENGVWKISYEEYGGLKFGQ